MRVATLLLALAVTGPSLRAQAGFPHDRHANLFPSCTTCHAGVTSAGAPLWPEPSQCASCHDGTVRRSVSWSPRTTPRPGNRRFTHDAHQRAVTARNAADSALGRQCSSCHTVSGAARMNVRPAVVGACLECHGLSEPHLDVAPSACATCHVPLSNAPSYTRDDIAEFPAPSSHRARDFVLGAHGRLAQQGVRPGEIAANCATCHTRELCLECHVNAPETPVIQSLATDARAPSHVRVQPVPVSHAIDGFLNTHGRDARARGATCATCHTRESCTTCHADAPPAPVRAMPRAESGRAPGAHVERGAPPSHTWDFRTRHAAIASARPASCESCHARSMCLECHRPDNERQAAFHPRGFLTRHPAAAYARVANCSDCHNRASFCQDCHQRSGVVARARLGAAGYHDAFRGFAFGHGQAARQNLESCASCHAERDCAACHSANGGFRFSPHGPGFNADRLRARSPSMCAACHGPTR